MSNELMDVRDKPLSKEQLLAQVRTVQEVMHTVMKNGEHYGVVPGCGDKPTLLKPGSEKLLHTFGFSTELDVTPMFSDDEDKVGYRVVCRVLTRDGRLMGSGVGEASSEEKKWKWREAVCLEEWEEAMDDQRQKKWKKWNGKVETVLQIKNNPYDLSNTILKMAKKRAQVDATLTVCACSDIFSQDLEELVDNGQAPRQAPRQATRPAPARSTKSTSGPCAPKTSFFKEYAGKPWTEVPLDQLDWYAEAIYQNTLDPEKAKYKKSNEAVLEQIVAEINARQVHPEPTEEEMDELNEKANIEEDPHHAQP